MIRYGSYFLRCRACGTDAVATSYMAVGPSETYLQAIAVDDDWNVIEIIGEGSGQDLYDKVNAAAGAGKLITLVKPGMAP